MKTLYGKILMIEWQQIGWVFALLSGYIVTTAYEVSELIKYTNKVTTSFVIQKLCALVVVFFLGYLLKVHIKLYVNSEDVQAGLFACVGALGFSLFGIAYRIIGNKKAWSELFFVFFRRWAGQQYQSLDNKNDNDGM